MIFNLLDAHCRLVGSFSTEDKALEAMKNYREAIGGLAAIIVYTELDEDKYAI